VTTQAQHPRLAEFAAHYSFGLDDFQVRACRVLEDRRDVEGALTHAIAMGDVERAGRILRAALDRSMSMAEGADVAARALRLWFYEFGAAFVETDPAGVVEFLIGLITLDGADDAPSWLDAQGVEWLGVDAVGRVRGSAPDRTPEAAR